MPEARIASVAVPAKRSFNTTESGVDDFKAKPQRKSEGDISSLIPKSAGNGPLMIKKEGTITQFLSLLVLWNVLSTDRQLFMSENMFFALQIINVQQQSPMQRTLLPIPSPLFQMESCQYPKSRYRQRMRLRLSFPQCRPQSFGDCFYRISGR